MSTPVLIVGLLVFWAVALPIVGLAYNLMVGRDKRLSAHEMVMMMARFLCSTPVVIAFVVIFILAFIRGF